MNYERLKKIEIELNRFNKVIKEAIITASKVPDMSFNNSTYNVGIAHTHLSGAVKRKYIDMKYEINKIINS